LLYIYIGVCGVKVRGILGKLKEGVKIKKITKMHVGYQMKGIFNVISYMYIVIEKIFLYSQYWGGVS